MSNDHLILFEATNASHGATWRAWEKTSGFGPSYHTKPVES